MAKVDMLKKPSDSHASMAIDLLSLALDAGVPDSYWHTDRRIQNAIDVLHQSGITTMAECISIARDRTRT